MFVPPLLLSNNNSIPRLVVRVNTFLHFSAFFGKIILSRGRLSCKMNAMAGNSKQLAEWVEEVLSKRNIKSSRQAETSMDGALSYATLNNMKNGRKVSAQSVILFAQHFGISPDVGLRACGYIGMADAVEGSNRIGNEDGSIGADAGQPVDDLTYEPLTDAEEELVSFYRGVAPTLQPAALAAWKAMIEKLPDPEEYSGFGKGTGARTVVRPAEEKPEDRGF